MGRVTRFLGQLLVVLVSADQERVLRLRRRSLLSEQVMLLKNMVFRILMLILKVLVQGVSLLYAH